MYLNPMRYQWRTVGIVLYYVYALYISYMLYPAILRVKAFELIIVGKYNFNQTLCTYVKKSHRHLT